MKYVIAFASPGVMLRRIVRSRGAAIEPLIREIRASEIFRRSAARENLSIVYPGLQSLALGLALTAAPQLAEFQTEPSIRTSHPNRPDAGVARRVERSWAGPASKQNRNEYKPLDVSPEYCAAIVLVAVLEYIFRHLNRTYSPWAYGFRRIASPL